jgi:hypothetical protein
MSSVRLHSGPPPVASTLQPTANTAAVAPTPPIESALTIDDICKIRNESRRTGERERSEGLWPKPDFYVGTGRRKSPRWRPSTIRSWLDHQ